uniref:NADH dehydrogenase [ubiquinone] 1 beta subcomplex subunit 8, mitochondrial n=1 Tax=Timema monikensis TaxID=170555 RepID=A0A7R9DZ22_9NEOP|nr:unnamed protein product [Timema monikensis]
MASIVKVLHIPKIIKYGYCPAYQVVRNHWNKDYKPGPYPVTQKERDAAAKKYGLLPAEYEPYPDDGLGYGDYPKLPAISGDDKDPYYPWDFPEHKRNFNEPVHVDADMYGEDRYNRHSECRDLLSLPHRAILSAEVSPSSPSLLPPTTSNPASPLPHLTTRLIIPLSPDTPPLSYPPMPPSVFR